jgi:H+/gluconate symporter-like permease
MKTKKLILTKEQKEEFKKAGLKILLTGIPIIIILIISQILGIYPIRDIMILVAVIWAFYVTNFYYKILYKEKKTKKYAEFLIKTQRKTFPIIMIIAVVLISIYLCFIYLIFTNPFFERFKFLTEYWTIVLITILIIIVPVLLSFVWMLHQEKKKFGVIYR